jgi:hypothetical protein
MGRLRIKMGPRNLMSIHQKISQFLAEPMDTANGDATALSSEKIQKIWSTHFLRRTSASAGVEATRNGIRFVC